MQFKLQYQFSYKSTQQFSNSYMQTDGYVEANRHFYFFFYIFHFEHTKLHSVYDSENLKKNHTMGVPTLIFFVLTL
jgi:hypothetical protein